MGWGTADKSYRKLMEKLEQLDKSISESTKAVNKLQKVIIDLDNQNQKIKIIGLVLTAVGAIDILIRITLLTW